MMDRKRTAESLAPFLGRDLRLDYALRMGFFEDADLSPARVRGGEKDLQLNDGIDNLTQALANRLKTRKGELVALGHPDYGSRHHELIGEPNVERTRNLIKIHVLRALRDEPRVKVLTLDVHPESRTTVRIEASLHVEGEPSPINLVVPFSLEVSL